MLLALHIENIAVIESMDIEFGPGLNVLTGETGAGKSIVIDALDLTLGGRTSREIVRAGAPNASVTAQFSSANARFWCEENGVSCEEDTLVLGRRVGADGKSVCRVNGAPVTVTQLRDLGALLLDIHGQNDGRQLMDEARHLDYLDRFGGLDSRLRSYKEAYSRYAQTKSELNSLKLTEAERERLTDNLKYQIEELSSAAIYEGEEEELAVRRELLRNSGKLKDTIDGAYEAVYAGEYSAVGLLSEAESFMRYAAGLGAGIEKAAGTISEARLMLEDAAETLRDFRERLDFSPDEYDAIENRFALLKRLSKKYGLDASGLAGLLDESRVRLDDMEYLGDRLVKLEKELEARRAEALESAGGLSAFRRKAAEELNKRIQTELKDLNMPSVRFEAEMLPIAGEPGFDSHGCDEVRFLISANAGEEPGRISRIASGGELSRIMLTMKSVFAETGDAHSMVFDEIDAGVSGVAAQRVGEKLARLAGLRQVLCVTHLPQIAAMADTHFAIYKEERAGRTYTGVTELNRKGRQMELARLHGGENITETTLRGALEQLEAAEKFKKGIR